MNISVLLDHIWIICGHFAIYFLHSRSLIWGVTLLKATVISPRIFSRWQKALTPLNRGPKEEGLTKNTSASKIFLTTKLCNLQLFFSCQRKLVISTLFRAYFLLMFQGFGGFFKVPFWTFSNLKKRKMLKLDKKAYKNKYVSVRCAVKNWLKSPIRFRQ